MPEQFETVDHHGLREQYLFMTAVGYMTQGVDAETAFLRAKQTLLEHQGKRTWARDVLLAIENWPGE